MTEPTIKVTKTRDVRIQGDLWHTSQCLLERGQEQARGSYHQWMASLVFTAFALEAYLNWLGQKVVANWKERRSPHEKLKIITKQFGITHDYNSRPWNIMEILFGFRNDIAHGKSEQIRYMNTEPLDHEWDQRLGEILKTKWEKFCSVENAIRAREDVLQIAETLHKQAHLEPDGGPFFGGFQNHSATFQGIFGNE